MRSSSAIALCIGLAASVTGISVAAAGCGSTQRVSISDDGSFEGGGPIFGGEGGEGSRPCTGLACQRANCSGGATTTITGKVFAPNGKLALYNAIVYIPNAEPEPITKGATCDKCGAVTGEPIVTALSDPTGKF